VELDGACATSIGTERMRHNHALHKTDSALEMHTRERCQYRRSKCASISSGGDADETGAREHNKGTLAAPKVWLRPGQEIIHRVRRAHRPLIHHEHHRRRVRQVVRQPFEIGPYERKSDPNSGATLKEKRTCCLGVERADPRKLVHRRALCCGAIPQDAAYGESAIVLVRRDEGVTRGDQREVVCARRERTRRWRRRG